MLECGRPCCAGGRPACMLASDAGSSVLVTMVGMGDAGAEDNLEARLEDARRRHLAGDYRETLPLAVVEAGIRAEWVAEHPLQPASCRSTNTEGGVDVGVNANDQVGSSAGGTPGQRGVIHADEVGGVQARGLQSSMAAGSSKGDVRGRWSSVISASATHVMAGGIAPTYGYFKSRQTRSVVETPPASNTELRVEFRPVQLLTFTVISRCCSPGLHIALKSCRSYLDASHQAWQFIRLTYQVTDDLYIG
ncbi:unnamed protein product [Closterium sp. NIES-54]